MYKGDAQQRIEASYKLLITDTTTRQKFDHIRTMIRGINPKIDELLEAASHALSAYEKLTTADVITLSVDLLPEQSEEQKKRKKALVFFIQSWNQLKSEVERIKTEFEHNQHGNTNEKLQSAGRIATLAKGPFGIITIVAIIIAGILLYWSSPKGKAANTARATPSIPVAQPSQYTQIKGIIVNGKKIPLTELFVGHGPDCDSPHYHALNETAVTALDGTILKDPGGCGFGRVNEVAVVNF